MKHLLICLFFLLNSVLITAQKPIKPTSSEIYESIKKLNFLGSVLYLAAHPDDENTRLISYFSNEVKARTAYLSITRGDGGQNLIGSELRELLGIIRTQELLAARRTDGGEQFFTRANDFGYSKHPDETLQIWNKDEVLKDVVSIIRKFKPDVIINRFNVASAGKTHGHHTSSAMLSVEAFDLVGDATFKSHNLYQPWQPKRLFFNTTWWFYGSRENFEKADKSNMLSFDIGVYYPSLGLSNNEIASLSRSQHKSQGFGSTGSRGSQKEYIELLKGEFPKNDDVFDGIDTTWNRIEGGAAIGEILSKVESNFDFKDPSTSISELIKAYKRIKELKDEHWKVLKLKEIKKIITACAGLYLEAVADTPSSYPNDEVSFNVEVINRSNVSVELNSVTIKPMHKVHDSEITMKIVNTSKVNLQNNKRHRFTLKGIIPHSVGYTTPYWLDDVKGSLGMYGVTNKKYIGNPETPKPIKAIFSLNINEELIDFEKNVIYKFNSPVKGEVYQPFEILPPVSVKVDNKIIITKPKAPIEINVSVKSFKDSVNGYIIFDLPDSWMARPHMQEVQLLKKGEEKTFTFLLNTTSNKTISYIKPTFVINNDTYDKEVVKVNYSHIPVQTILLPSESKVVQLDIQKKGQLIGYIQGAGDAIPTSLRQIGYTVIEIDEKDITAENLQNFDAVILGIRAYNVSDRAKFYQKEIHKYTENGGTLIVQYNTSRRTKVENVAPYDLKLSRDRVADENAKVTLINSTHEILNYPNKITESDFEGWIQERGLYFPNEWGEEFTPLLSMQDKGESPKKGSLLVAKYGKGHFIYTGLSFFRELPAGVPGAYKLFANMLSVGKNDVIKPLKN